jgi:succinyl-CoA synthetase beta subunit
MSTKKKKQILNAKKITAPTATDQFAAVKAKFTKLKEIREQLATMKALYQEHDALMTELLPLFITKTDSQFIINREITVGTEKHQLKVNFYDEKKALLLAKSWKSSAFETGYIE